MCARWGLCWGPAGGGAGPGGDGGRADSPGVGRRASDESAAGAGGVRPLGGRGLRWPPRRAQPAGLSSAQAGWRARGGGRHLGPAGRRHTLPGARPTRPVRAGLTWAVLHAADRAAAQDGGPGRAPMAQRARRERKCECAQRGRHTAREAVPPSRSCPSRSRPSPGPAPPRPWGRPAPPPPPAEHRVARNRGPPFPPASRPLSTSGAGPPPVPAHLARPQFRASGRLSHSRLENSRRDLAPPGLGSGGPRVRTPARPIPAPSRPIRRRAPGPALIPDPRPTAGSRREMPAPRPPHSADLLGWRSGPAALVSRNPAPAPPRPGGAAPCPGPGLPQPGPEHTAPLSGLSSLCYIWLCRTGRELPRAGWHDSAGCLVQPDRLSVPKERRPWFPWW